MESASELGVQPLMADSRAQTGLPAGVRFGLAQAWKFIFRPKESYASLRRQYGDVVTLFNTPVGNVVLTLTPEGARQVLTSDPDGYDASNKKAFSSLAGAGSLLILEGARHRAERRILMPAFHSQNVIDFGRLVRETTVTHTDLWRPGQRIRALDTMLEISRDFILRIVFGIEGGPLLDEARAALATLLRSIRPTLMFTPALHTWWFPPWRAYQGAKRDFSRFLARCMAERRRTGKESNDVLGVLMAARRDDGTPLSDEEIFGEVGTIVLAGQKNVALVLAWALYELARHPSVLNRLRDELAALGPDPDPNLIAKQPYLGAVCNETMRLRPIHTEIGRVCKAPLKLFNYILPTGTCVGVGICAIHQDPGIYPEPEKFLPERFIDRSYSLFEFLPFGGGHRRCIGAAFAEYQVRVALATIVTRWELDALGKDREARKNLSMGPKRGVPMRVLGRRQ